MGTAIEHIVTGLIVQAVYIVTTYLIVRFIAHFSFFETFHLPRPSPKQTIGFVILMSAFVPHG